MLPKPTSGKTAVFVRPEGVISLPIDYTSRIGFICFNRLSLLQGHIFLVENKPSNSYFHTSSNLVNEYSLTSVHFSGRLNNSLVMGKQDNLVLLSQVSHGLDSCP
jgi:hypothetical protein